jgi:hypothetical protein
MDDRLEQENRREKAQKAHKTKELLDCNPSKWLCFAKIFTTDGRMARMTPIQKVHHVESGKECRILIREIRGL